MKATCMRATCLHENRGMSRIPFDPEAIRALAALLVETGLSEIELAERDSRIRVVRAAPVVVAAPPAALALAAPHVANAVPAPAEPKADDAQHPGAVTSPMVGVVYLAPQEPGAPGLRQCRPERFLVAGQTLLLIEAMKTSSTRSVPQGPARVARDPGQQRRAGRAWRGPHDPGMMRCSRRS